MERKSHIVKIIAALGIACVYIFAFGIIQVVSVGADSTHQIEVNVPVYTTPADNGGAPPVTTKPSQTTKPATSKPSETEDPDGEETGDPEQTDTPDEELAWNETDLFTTMYVNTDGIYSRDSALIGYSSRVQQYSYGDKVTVIAKTDTDYYKLKDGSYIHKDYLDTADPINQDDTSDNSGSDNDNSGGGNGSGGDDNSGGDTNSSDGNSGDNNSSGGNNSDDNSSDDNSSNSSDDNNSGGGSTTDETFTVYDQASGAYVTGDAYEIIVRTVINEVGTAWPDEVIKAQAVAAYTHIKKENQSGSSPTVALRPMSDATDRVLSLISEVFGEAIYYDGALINCSYYASSCGYTNSSENEWGGYLPYLVSVDCPFDTDDPNYGRTTTFTAAQVKNIITTQHGVTLSDDNKSEWIKVAATLDGRENGWVTSAVLGGSYSVHGRTIRSNFSLPSEAFTVKYDSATDTFTFTTYGYGHGVGMSQNGAKILADSGYTYKQILQHYFTGVTIK
ncbi:MAG: SpoIID/LytB domain-containing protein [Eubacterium sp.]|nr:SpoIID/LytB domain-containing protein [Eubacterium sp.]